MYNKVRWVSLTIVANLLFALFVTAFIPLHASAIGDIEVIVQYNPDANELPEGIAVDKQGNIYVSLAPLGEIWKLAPDGTQSRLTTLDPEGGVGLLGLAVDAPGNVYAGLASSSADTHGVYRVGRDGASERLAGSEAIGLPNALAFDKRGNLYVTDSILGAVWRIPRQGPAELWLQHELLEGTGDFGFPFPIGANGIAYRQNTLYVANTEKGQLVRVAIEPDGDAGTPQLLIADQGLLFGADGIALDVHGNIYAVNVAADLLVRIDLAGSSPTATVLATEDNGLDGPASLAFGTGKGARQSLFITNFAVLSGENPALLKVNVGVPGLPLP